MIKILLFVLLLVGSYAQVHFSVGQKITNTNGVALEPNISKILAIDRLQNQITAPENYFSVWYKCGYGYGVCVNLYGIENVDNRTDVNGYYINRRQIRTFRLTGELDNHLLRDYTFRTSPQGTMTDGDFCDQDGITTTYCYGKADSTDAEKQCQFSFDIVSNNKELYDYAFKNTFNVVRNPGNDYLILSERVEDGVYRISVRRLDCTDDHRISTVLRLERSSGIISYGGVAFYNPPRIQLIVNFKDILDNDLSDEIQLSGRKPKPLDVTSGDSTDLVYEGLRPFIHNSTNYTDGYKRQVINFPGDLLPLQSHDFWYSPHFPYFPNAQDPILFTMIAQNYTLPMIHFHLIEHSVFLVGWGNTTRVPDYYSVYNMENEGQIYLGDGDVVKIKCKFPGGCKYNLSNVQHIYFKSDAERPNYEFVYYGFHMELYKTHKLFGGNCEVNKTIPLIPDSLIPEYAFKKGNPYNLSYMDEDYVYFGSQLSFFLILDLYTNCDLNKELLVPPNYELNFQMKKFFRYSDRFLNRNPEVSAEDAYTHELFSYVYVQKLQREIWWDDIVWGLDKLYSPIDYKYFFLQRHPYIRVTQRNTSEISYLMEYIGFDEAYFYDLGGKDAATRLVCNNFTSVKIDLNRLPSGSFRNLTVRAVNHLSTTRMLQVVGETSTTDFDETDAEIREIKTDNNLDDKFIFLNELKTYCDEEPKKNEACSKWVHLTGDVGYGYIANKFALNDYTFFLTEHQQTLLYRYLAVKCVGDCFFCKWELLSRQGELLDLDFLDLVYVEKMRHTCLIDGGEGYETIAPIAQYLKPKEYTLEYTNILIQAKMFIEGRAKISRFSSWSQYRVDNGDSEKDVIPLVTLIIISLLVSFGVARFLKGWFAEYNATTHSQKYREYDKQFEIKV